MSINLCFKQQLNITVIGLHANIYLAHAHTCMNNKQNIQNNYWNAQGGNRYTVLKYYNGAVKLLLCWPAAEHSFVVVVLVVLVVL